MIVVYLSDVVGTPIAQVFDVYGFTCRAKLSDYNEATFSIKNDNPIASYENLREYNRVVIQLEIEGGKKQFIDGFIKTTTIGIEETTVTVRSREYILTKKLVHVARAYTTSSIKAILEDLLNEINTRSNTGITVHPDTSLDVLPLDVNKNTTLQSVLKTIAGKGYSFKIIDKKLLVGQEIGTDRTIPDIVTYYNTGFYNFDGVDDYLATTTKHTYPLGTTTNIVIAGRFKLWADAVDTYDSQPIISLPYCYMHVRNTNNQLILRYDNAGSRVAFTILGSGDRNRHYYIAAVYFNGTNWTTDLYLDGFLANTANHGVAPSLFIADEIIVGKRAGKYFAWSIKAPTIYTFTGTKFFASDAALIRAGSTPTYTLWIKKYVDWTFNTVHTKVDTNNLNSWTVIDVASDLQLNLALTTASSYTHLINIQQTPDNVVNGVTMNRSVGEWSYSVTGTPSQINNNLWWWTVIGAERSKIEEDFQYWINSRTITMSGLTIGEKYTFVWFNGDWDGNDNPASATVKLTINGITSQTYTRDRHRIFMFDYIPTATSIDVIFQDGGTGTPHFYGFANGVDLRGLKIYGAPALTTDNSAPFVIVEEEDNGYFELKRKRDEPGDTNVRDVSIAYDADTISNAITEKTTGFTTDAGSIAQYGRLEENITADGGISESVTKALDIKKSSTAQVDIDPLVDDFFFATVGDKLQANIDLGNNITVYSGPVYVTEISVRGEGLKDVKAKVSNGTIYTKNLLETMKEYNERIKRLELQ